MRWVLDTHSTRCPCAAEKRHLAPAPMLPRKASHDVRHGQETLEALRHGVVNTEVNTQFEPKLPCGKYSEKCNAHAPKGRPSKFLFLSVKSPHNKNIIALCSARWQIYNWCFTIATCPAMRGTGTTLFFFSCGLLQTMTSLVLQASRRSWLTMECPTESSTTSLLRRSFSFFGLYVGEGCLCSANLVATHSSMQSCDRIQIYWGHLLL